MAKKIACHEKHRELGNFVKTQGKYREFCLNTGKTRGILLAQVVNVLILKVKDIALVATKKNPFFFQKLDNLPNQFCVCNTHKLLNWHRENLRSNSENTGRWKIRFEWVPCVTLILHPAQPLTLEEEEAVFSRAADLDVSFLYTDRGSHDTYSNQTADGE